MNRKPPRRSTWQESEQTPVVLPHVIITVTEPGVLKVTVDGNPFPPPADEHIWTRNAFGILLNAITKDRTSAVRIEIRETDGSVFTDIIRPGRRTTREPPSAAELEKQCGNHATRTRAPQLIEVTADGFASDENIAVAVIVSHTDAAGTGHAHTLLDKTQHASLLRDGCGEVVLLGRISGAVHVRRLP
ncbi:hypothetical protein [Arthrobacter sp. TB 23]|uniref:hypothetical protein n=1 Tax=Arthrobacter sp. TB 23 TaxID=494419 RepID=UPI0002EDA23B|nr:hypothetical protein [Arthrobacter sp. TB 23]